MTEIITGQRLPTGIRAAAVKLDHLPPRELRADARGEMYRLMVRFCYPGKDNRSFEILSRIDLSRLCGRDGASS